MLWENLIRKPRLAHLDAPSYIFSKILDRSMPQIRPVSKPGELKLRRALPREVSRAGFEPYCREPLPDWPTTGDPAEDSESAWWDSPPLPDLARPALWNGSPVETMSVPVTPEEPAPPVDPRSVAVLHEARSAAFATSRTSVGPPQPSMS